MRTHSLKLETTPDRKLEAAPLGTTSLAPVARAYPTTTRTGAS
jgi:hypothetical protein